MDEFDSILNELKELHSRKAKDYSKDNDRFSNFKIAGEFAGIETWRTFEVLLGVKQSRILELRSNNKTPNNESTRDTYVDRCVYSILSLMYYDQGVE